MFKLIATIIVMLNGTPSGEPEKVAHKFKFASMEQCEAFKDGPASQDSVDKLNKMIEMRLPKDATHTVTLSCEKAAQIDDGSI